MKDAVWFLLFTAIGIPLGGVVQSLISSRFDRVSARQSALLSAAQQLREAEITQMREAMNDLLDAATAVQSFAWFVDDDGRSTTKDRETFEKYGPLIKDAVVGAQRLRTLARILPPGDLADSFTAVERLIIEVVRGSDDPSAPDPWHEDVSGPEPSTVTRAVNATADEIRRLYATYPSELGPLSGIDTPRGVQPVDFAIIGALGAASLLAFLAGWFW
ncbi:hypothetical protein [Mycobacterium sp.]|uniref:hypothetical protein n=1 Tax=Mycobacterium sp. TaxID=1785 RepID=UPI0025D97862|nr:hypothetical protein [Mycobacterium sp.]